MFRPTDDLRIEQIRPLIPPAILMENQLKTLLKETSTQADIIGFQNVAFPIVRRVFAGLIANELVSVQPMSLPSGLLFYMDYRYESKGWNREHIGACDGIGKTSTIIADPKMFPHKCPRCSAPAYVGFMKVDCSRKSCI